ncbi:hypothetical protein [Bacteroides fragilis]|uniref:hypothetical protein n=1 Tax=Bacteroides fragilis TaxID=817 RepID=UPI0022E544BB|nr:hypothetical protein [Bacteroides fragilis]
MGFTTPCFIRKNTEELRNKLKGLGYYCNPYLGWNNLCTSTYGLASVYSMSDDINVISKEMDIIDCGTNEELFLAIVALRDDTDKNQWFICTEDYIESPDKEWKVGDWDLNTCPDVTYGQQLSHWRKATVEELINHFK